MSAPVDRATTGGRRPQSMTPTERAVATGDISRFTRDLMRMRELGAEWERERGPNALLPYPYCPSTDTIWGIPIASKD